MIVRLLTEGQYRVSDDLTGRLSEARRQGARCLDSDNEQLAAHLEAMWALVQGRATPCRRRRSSAPT